ncbi:PEPxxWA-CTERM sorting domain-containing protein [Phenylobacterium sp.]|uniref:PEPxxWA-CTERM sorting domain-containing protein n=1 Tax=Phenylobacterium sp. TaxID=1871053 RepID=UPI002C196BC1|nr:PEPxxWA-CTERM sorting domain-containing protein [Phenylobacterium sp.]HLZ73892.1 PEPxxWA-CTERM sorting domain-containing protein [Phenylobacterium sp.]
MRSMVLAAVAALGVAAGAGAAEAASGTATISFGFTSFSGPFGDATAATLSDPSQWLLRGLVDGQTPTPNGVTTNAGFGNLYVGGTSPLSGQSVDMIYSNLPGALNNNVTFTPEASTGFVHTGQKFLLGTLSFTNGQWVGGSGNPATNYPTTLNFHLATSSATPQFNQVLDSSFTVVTNQAASDIDCATNPATQMAEADFIYFTAAPKLGSMRVYDSFCAPAGVSSTGAVDVWASFGSLDLISFSNPTGGAFIEDSVTPGPLNGVPEPTAWALMVAGFGLVGWELRRRRWALA